MARSLVSSVGWFAHSNGWNAPSFSFLVRLESKSKGKGLRLGSGAWEPHG